MNITLIQAIDNASTLFSKEDITSSKRKLGKLEEDNGKLEPFEWIHKYKAVYQVNLPTNHLHYKDNKNSIK